MLILDLVANHLAVVKLAARGITGDEIDQVIGNDPAVGDNPNSRVDGSKILVGHRDIARFLTVVLQPDDDSATRWHVMTAWDSSARQIDSFHRKR
ncbi:MAG: hypothetical protein ACR2JU_06430 [Nocardioidaceae bacterium]